MQLEIGQVLNGTVVKITKFGAFVKVQNNLTGLVHISEISKSFVSDISSFLEIGDEVKVKVLNNEIGKINFSIKQAQEIKEKSNFKKTNISTNKTTHFANTNPATFKKINDKAVNLSFEEMLNKFKKNSEENLANAKRNSDGKRNSYSKRR